MSSEVEHADPFEIVQLRVRANLLKKEADRLANRAHILVPALRYATWLGGAIAVFLAWLPWWTAFGLFLGGLFLPLLLWRKPINLLIASMRAFTASIEMENVLMRADACQPPSAETTTLP